MNNKSAPKKRKNTLGRYLFFAIILCYILIRLLPVMSSSINETSIAEYGSITIVDEIEGYIIRNEKTVYSNMEGNIKYFIHQGEKVEKGYNIVEINADIVDDTTKNQLEVINQRIENLTNDNQNLLFENDVEKLTFEIDELIKDIKESNSMQDLLKVEFLKKDLHNKLQKKNIISGEKSFADKNISELQEEQELLETKMASSMELVKSSESGIISYYIDGYENLLNLKSIEVLKLENLNEITEGPVDVRTDYVINNQPIFKIIDNQLLFIIAKTDSQLSDYYQAGKAVVFKLPKGDIQAQVYKRVDNQDYDMVIFKVTEFTEELINKRQISVETIVVNYEGLQIFRDSIVQKDDKNGVYVLDINRNTVFKPIKIIGYDKENVIVQSNVFFENIDGETHAIETIKLYDEIVRNADGVREGQLVL